MKAPALPFIIASLAGSIIALSAAEKQPTATPSSPSWSRGLPTAELAPASAPDASGWHFEELRRFAAPEARQGAASDGEFIYAINNRAIGKYRAATGERVARWEDARDGGLIHLNAGVVHEGKLYCAHSNYPAVPMQSSIEIWDAATLQHIGSRSLGRTDGSLTWLDRRGGRWIACFVHYGKKGGEPGRGPEWTHLVEFDDDWRATGGWSFPADLIARLSPRGYSCSGGAFGPDGVLFVTGHDAPELYALEFPVSGSQLRWRATIPVTAEGQAFGWDPRQRGVAYFVQRPGSVIVGRLTRGESETDGLAERDRPNG